MTAVQHGAIMANHVEVTALHKRPDPSRGGEERIYAASMKDRMSGEEWTVRTRVSGDESRQSHVDGR
jgi:glycerol-3-phosphate dehydrogenase